MVLINGVKYACERCIRGHRVTTCNHTDQPLMMIKPKGRPSTTCAYCKELRKNKSAKPPGTCTCGRQEKRRQAQKAKEEARAKAKELAAQNCTCGTQIICKVHPKRQNRKVSSQNNTNNTNNNSLLSQRRTKSRTKIDRMTSSTSLDSQFFMSQNGGNDGMNHFSSTFLDSDTSTGKISKDYHHVPSLASISSLQSSQSLDQNFAPQSPQLSSMQFSFLSENPATYAKYGHTKAKTHTWDSTKNPSIPNRSDSHLNLLETTLTSGLDPLNNTKKVQNPNKFNIGEVVIPLEEYIPSNINGIGKVDDMQSWSEEPSLNRGIDNNSSTLPEIRPTSFNRVQSPPQKSIDIPTSGNGLLDMFSDSSSISTLSRANLLLQERNDRSNNKNLSNGRNPMAGWNGVLKDKPFTPHHVPQIKSEYSKSINDNESVASVEVLSLMPSFMDIPETENDSRRFRRSRTNLNINSSNFNRQRSNSIDRNHKYSKNAHNSTMTINPSTVNNNVDNGELMNPFQQPEGNIPHTGSFLINKPTNNNKSNNIINYKDNSKKISPTRNDTFELPMESKPDSNLTLMTDNVPNESNQVFNGNDMATLISPQTSSPTELLSDQGFAELDNFLSTL